MPTIEFTATPKLPDDYRHLGYVKGTRITDRQGWCEKWVSRGVAVFVADEPEPATVAEPVATTDEAGEPAVEPVVEPAAEPVVEPAEPRRAPRARR